MLVWQKVASTGDISPPIIKLPRLSQESERLAESMREVQSELLHLVRLEREAEHIVSAVEHAERLATALQTAEVPKVAARAVHVMLLP